MNKAISSDNLKDAVRRWHAKRKKDSNNQAGNEDIALDSEGTANTKKHDTRHATWSHNGSIESNQLPHNVSEQKRQRSTVIENNIKYIFDGPLSFDAIMALKKKKSSVVFGNNEKILNNSSIIEQIGTNCPLTYSYLPQVKNSSAMEDFKDKVDIIYSKSIDNIQNFFRTNSMLDIINILECIFNGLSLDIQELVHSYNVKIDTINDNSEKSLSVCIDLILHKSNLTADRLDETSLEFLAKYPKVFESLKALTKMEGLNNTMPNEISNHIHKLNLQIDKVYNLLLNE